MSMSDKQSSSDVLLPECPLCDIKGTPQVITLLQASGESRLLHVVCRKCKGAILMVCIEGEHGTRSVGLVTDLSAVDIRRLAGKSALSFDDAIELHKLLRSPSFFKGLSASLPVKVKSSGYRANR